MARSSTPSPTTWGSARTRTPGGTTCWRTGPASRYGAYFDIAWRSSPRPELQDKILLSVLGDPYGDVLEAGQLRLAFADGAFSIHYYDRRFPVAPRSYSNILAHRLDELERALGPEDPALLEYQSILTAIRNLPEHNETDLERVAERQREKEVIKRRLAALAAESEPVRRFIEENVAAFNGRPGDPRSFDLLDDLMERQCYRLAYWRVAPDEINYRRFFDINDLAALSMEREDVFEAAHRLVLRLVAEGKVDGLRIDHPDGLYDPAQYFRRLQEHHALALARRAFDAGPGAGRGLGRGGGPPARAHRREAGPARRPAGPAALRRRREDPRRRRGAGREPGRSTGPAATTSSTRSTACSSTPTPGATSPVGTPTTSRTTRGSASWPIARRC